MPKPTLILVHGAATGAWIWEFWRRHLTPLGWEVNVLDLKGHGRSLPVDLSTTTMEDYVADLDSVCGQIEAARGAQPIVGGWEMGGLVAMMYAAQHPTTPGLILFSPEMPLEVAGRGSIEEQRRHPQAVLGPDAFGVFTGDPEASRTALGDLTDDEQSRVFEHIAGAQESGLAYRQRLRGISIPRGSIACPTLILNGALDVSRAEGAAGLAAHLGAESLCLEAAGRWGIVYSDAIVARAAPLVDAWLREHFTQK